MKTIYIIYISLNITIKTQSKPGNDLGRVTFQCTHEENNSLSSNPTKKLNSVASVRERTIPTERPPLVGTKECHVVSMTDPYGRILGFLDRRRYFFIQAAPQLYSRGWVDPVLDPLFLRKSGSADNRTRDLWIYSQELWPLDHRGGHSNPTANACINRQTAKSLWLLPSMDIIYLARPLSILFG
jgi:hypothetical protein